LLFGCACWDDYDADPDLQLLVAGLVKGGRGGSVGDFLGGGIGDHLGGGVGDRLGGVTCQ